MKKNKLILLVLLLTLTSALTSISSAEIPHVINFQGKATDKQGMPLNDKHDLTFRIYNHATAGELKWEEKHQAVEIKNGIFHVLLGSATPPSDVTPLDLPFDEDYWISIEVNEDGEMKPRTRLASVGYAYKAESAEEAGNTDTVGGFHASTTPEANKILPLNADAKLPASTIPSDIGIKAWVNFDGTDGSIQDSYNVTSVRRHGKGDYTITWETDFASEDYAVVGMHKDSTPVQMHIDAQAAGSIRVKCTQNGTSTSRDSDSVSVIAIGDQLCE